MPKTYYFDHAATTCCCPPAAEALKKYADVCYGNPSSSHRLGQEASKALKQAKDYFGEIFDVSAKQVIFTGSGSASDNLAIYGIATAELAKQIAKEHSAQNKPRIICSAIEHPAVMRTVESLADLGFDIQKAPIDSNAQIDREAFLELVTPETILVSIQTVNNIVGSILEVEDLAKAAKEKNPDLIFHTDAIQAFGKVDLPRSGSPIDLVSISAHKIYGPKGIGALILLNNDLLQPGKIRPLVWGGGQEEGLRSGTQPVGQIAAFHAAAVETLSKQKETIQHCLELKNYLIEKLQGLRLLGDDSTIRLNTPQDKVVPNIINFSVPGFPNGPLSMFLEERNCMVATGSACSSKKAAPDSVLKAMGKNSALQTSTIRVSLGSSQSKEDIDVLVQALQESLEKMKTLLGG